MSETPKDFLRRIFPSAEQAAFAFELVKFQLDELNALGDRLRFAAAHSASDEDILELRARCSSIPANLMLNAAEVVAQTWRWLKEPLMYAEDAFGAALLLTRLDPDDARYRAWLASLNDEAVSMLDGLGFELVPPNSRGP